MSVPSSLLNLPGAVGGQGADEAVAIHYGNPNAEQRDLASGIGIVDRSNASIVTVTGPDRLSWLHSITSQDLTNLSAGTSAETLILSPQGHIEYALEVIDDGQTTWLITAPGAGERLSAWLNRMKFMLRVEIVDATEQYAVIETAQAPKDAANQVVSWVDPWPNVLSGGTRYGPAPSEHPAANYSRVHTIIARDQLENYVQEAQRQGLKLAGLWASEALRIEAWRPSAQYDVDERTIPHELDWLRTAVHLHKGCYRGQETIARVHNLGRPPRRLTMLHLDGSGHLLPEIGAILTSAGRPVGKVTSVAQHHELGPIALAIIKRGTDPQAQLEITVQDESVTATQEIIVTPQGESADRPAPRGQTAKGLRLR